MNIKRIWKTLAGGSRAIIFGTCVFAALAAVFTTIAPGLFGQNAAMTVSAPAEETTADPMTQFRTEREQTLALQTAELNGLIYGVETDDDIRLLAQEKLLSLIDRREKETLLEGVLHMRGFENAVVTVSEGSVNVLLRTESITRQQAAVILELVLRETGVTGGNVKIIPVP